jgi:hypothetical protein
MPASQLEARLYSQQPCQSYTIQQQKLHTLSASQQKPRATRLVRENACTSGVRIECTNDRRNDDDRNNFSTEAVDRFKLHISIRAI